MKEIEDFKDMRDEWNTALQLGDKVLSACGIYIMASWLILRLSLSSSSPVRMGESKVATEDFRLMHDMHALGHSHSW